MGITSIANSNDSDNFFSLFSQPLDGCYQIQFYSILVSIDYSLYPFTDHSIPPFDCPSVYLYACLSNNLSTRVRPFIHFSVCWFINQWCLVKAGAAIFVFTDLLSWFAAAVFKPFDLFLCRWVDGSAVDFFFWQPNEPSDHGGSEQCGQMFNHMGKIPPSHWFRERDNSKLILSTIPGFWNDYNCGIQNSGHICEKPVNGITLPATQTTRADIGHCRAGFQRLGVYKCYLRCDWFLLELCAIVLTFSGNKCFGVLGDDKPLNWSSAQQECRAQGIRYDLATILDSNEQSKDLYFLIHLMFFSLIFIVGFVLFTPPSRVILSYHIHYRVHRVHNSVSQR